MPVYGRGQKDPRNPYNRPRLSKPDYVENIGPCRNRTYNQRIKRPLAMAQRCGLQAGKALTGPICLRTAVSAGRELAHIWHGQANLISRLCSSVHGNKALIFFIAARELSTAGWPWSTPRTSPGAMQPRSSDARFAAWMRQAVRAFGYAASGQCSTLSSRFTKAHVLGCASVLCFSNRYVPTGTQETPFTLPNHGRSMV